MENWRFFRNSNKYLELTHLLWSIGKFRIKEIIIQMLIVIINLLRIKLLLRLIHLIAILFHIYI